MSTRGFVRRAGRAAARRSRRSPRRDRAGRESMLPLSAFPRERIAIETRSARRHVFEAWRADTPQTRAQGLMFVPSLRPDQAMIFVYEPPQHVGMWMKNTLIPLDMLFVDDDGCVVKVHERARARRARRRSRRRARSCWSSNSPAAPPTTLGLAHRRPRGATEAAAGRASRGRVPGRAEFRYHPSGCAAGRCRAGHSTRDCDRNHVMKHPFLAVGRGHCSPRAPGPGRRFEPAVERRGRPVVRRAVRRHDLRRRRSPARRRHASTARRSASTSTSVERPAHRLHRATSTTTACGPSGPGRRRSTARSPAARST